MAIDSCLCFVVRPVPRGIAESRWELKNCISTRKFAAGRADRQSRSVMLGHMIGSVNIGPGNLEKALSLYPAELRHKLLNGHTTTANTAVATK
jgi:hypothetical protein